MASVKLFEIRNSNKVRNIEVINKALPSPTRALRWIMLGPTSSGKSTIIKNVLFNNEWGYNKFYDEIYAFIKSKDDIAELNQLIKQSNMKHKIQIVESFNEYEVQDLFEDIETDAEDSKKSLNNVLFIFDDMILDNISNRSKTNIIDSVFMRGRHANISIIISSQRYKWLNLNMRCNNANVLSVFYGTKQSELNAVAEEHSGAHEPDDLLKLFRQHLLKKYDFMTIDYTCDTPYKDKNFKTILFNKQE
jgi:hypothetical protein